MTGLIPFMNTRARFPREFDGFFDEFFRGLEPAPRAEQEYPVSADVRETQKEYLLSFDLPGVAKDDVKVEYDRGVLSIAGERKTEHEEKTDGHFVSERRFGKFTRAFRLPENVDAEKIGAEFKDGVLKVTVPKSEEARPRTIRIAS